MAARAQVGTGKQRRVLNQSEMFAIFLRDKGVCRICDKPVTPETVSIDHIVPFAQGGPCEVSNLRLAHLICNESRGVGNDRNVPASPARSALDEAQHQFSVAMQELMSRANAWTELLEQEKVRLEAEVAVLKAQQALPAPRHAWWRFWRRR